MSLIEVEKLSRSYGTLKAVDEVSFAVEAGEIFGIIGPDGAGKTTLFRMLTTLLLPDSGAARVDGFRIVEDFREIRKHVGYMPGRFSLYSDLTVEENLRFFANVFHTTVEENIHLVNDIYKQIEPFKTRRAGKLSGGMKQKLALCCAMIHKPDVLFLDEPTTGVDPVSRLEFWDMLARLKQQGLAILVSTLYMNEANRCDRIALMKKGRFMIESTPAEIVESDRDRLFEVKASKMYPLLTDLRTMNGLGESFTFGEYHHVTVLEASLTADALQQALETRGHQHVVVHEITPGIEDCYLKLSHE